MGKQEDIFLGTCMHVIKDEFINRQINIEGNEDAFFVAVERLFKNAMERKLLELPDNYQK